MHAFSRCCDAGVTSLGHGDVFKADAVVAFDAHKSSQNLYMHKMIL